MGNGMTIEIWSITSNIPKDVGCRLVVVRTEQLYFGYLVITDNGVEKVRERVHLSFGAIFGPDVQDVQDWQDRFERWLDKERGTVA